MRFTAAIAIKNLALAFKIEGNFIGEVVVILALGVLAILICRKVQAARKAKKVGKKVSRESQKESRKE